MAEEKLEECLWPVQWVEDERLEVRTVGLEEFVYAFFWGHLSEQEVKRLCNEPLCWNPLHLQTKVHAHLSAPTSAYPFVLNRSIERQHIAQRLKAEKGDQWRFKYKQPIDSPHNHININLKAISKFRPAPEFQLDFKYD